jgi:naphthoate synthase
VTRPAGPRSDSGPDSPARADALNDVRYEVEGGLAWITIDRPDRLNAFRAQTIDELIRAFKTAWADSTVGVVALTGAGDRAFCVGGDQKQRQETGDYGPSASGLFEIEALHRVVRDIPKPVIAAVNGIAVGGGHVLHVICDLTIAAEHATFGQAGPKVGSFDAGLGTAYLARIVGEKRARQIWYLCEQHSARTAEAWGLVNKVVPAAELAAEVRRWADIMLAKSPTALKVLKHSFNADSESIAGIGSMAWDTLDLFVASEEAREGVAAFNDKRPPDFGRFRPGSGASGGPPT